MMRGKRKSFIKLLQLLPKNTSNLCLYEHVCFSEKIHLNKDNARLFIHVCIETCRNPSSPGAFNCKYLQVLECKYVKLCKLHYEYLRGGTQNLRHPLLASRLLRYRIRQEFKMSFGIMQFYLFCV